MGNGRRWHIRGVGGLGIAAIGLAGCQTYPAGFGGMTLPSPHYLKHYPQYFPPDPAFPLQRELDSMQDPEGIRRGPGAAPLPAPLPAPGQLPPPAPVNPNAVPPPVPK
jgi:hypothetical protein